MLGDWFDPNGELPVFEHCRPHWSQAGAVVFITFRTHDSIPRDVIERWDRQKQEWLALRGADPKVHWSGFSQHSPIRIGRSFSKLSNGAARHFWIPAMGAVCSSGPNCLGSSPTRFRISTANGIAWAISW
jgi:hypothetical protein